MYTYPKNFLSITQLIQKLKDTGMTIDSNDTAEIALTTIGYYRLKGYSFPSTKKYIEGTSLSDILRLYRFDSELSDLLFSYLSQIEVALKSQLVNAFQITHDALVLNDPSVFKDKKTFWKNQSTIASEISRSNDVFIEHNFDNHDGAIPIWAAVEVMSFGNGRDINPSKDMFTSWIQAVSIMRNICAHNSRIYNRSISTRPQLIYSDVIHPHPRYNGLYQIMLSMKYLRPTEDSWTAFITDFKQLLNNYSDVCDIRRLNFPSDWESHF